MSSQLLSIVVGVSGIFGLLSLLAYVFVQFSIKKNQRSLKDTVEGEGLFNSEQILSILTQFSDDNARLEALKELTNIDTRKSTELLGAIKSNVDIERLTSNTQRHNIKIVGVVGSILTIFAIIGLIYTFTQSKNTPSPIPPEETTQLPLKKSAIEKNVLVSGTQTWSHTGIEVEEGDTLLIEYAGGCWTGNVNNPNDPCHGPEGPPSDVYPGGGNYPIPGFTENSMIGRIGTYKFPIGKEIEITAKNSGDLFLGINDIGFHDNAGEITMRVKKTSK